MLTAEERGERFGSGLARMLLFGALLIWGLVAGIRALRRRFRRSAS